MQNAKFKMKNGNNFVRGSVPEALLIILPYGTLRERVKAPATIFDLAVFPTGRYANN